MFPRGEAEGNIEVEGNQNSLFPAGPENVFALGGITKPFLKRPMYCIMSVTFVFSNNGINNLVPRVSHLPAPWSERKATVR